MTSDLTATAPEDAPQAQSFSVELTQSALTIPCGADQFVLDAADAAGLRLPSSCRQGKCGTCTSKLVSGRVDMQHRGGIRQRQIDLGYVLICCSRPLTDLVIER